MHRAALDAIGTHAVHLELGQDMDLDFLKEEVETCTLDPELSHIAAEVLYERAAQNNVVQMLARNVQCKDEDDEEMQEVRKHMKKPGEDMGPFVRCAVRHLPMLSWFPLVLCDPRIVIADLVAGLTVGVMVIPQSMSYAAIAGLPYIYGMYSACVPTAVYAAFGQSRQLAVGPVAMVSLLVEAGLRGQLSEAECPEWYTLDITAQTDTPQYELCPDPYVKLAFLTSLAVGIFQLVASVLKLGFLVSFLGHPVISGFTSGAAIIIGLSQLKYVLGFEVPKSQYVYESLYNIYAGLHKTNPVTVGLGLAFLFFLMGNKKLSQKKFQNYPELSKRIKNIGPLGPLISCIAGSLLVYLLPVLHDEFDVHYVGDIPEGLPPMSLDFNMEDLPKVLSTAVTSCLIGYMESIAIGKSLAAKHAYEIEAGQELLALGIANAVGACFSCYPVTGSFSRSAVNNQTGALSQLSGLITAVMMLLTLMYLTPLFYYLPKFVLSAVVLNSVIALVAFGEAKHLMKTSFKDFVLWVTAFLGTLFVGVLAGILIAVGLSLVIVIYESVRPQITVLWRIPGTNIYRNLKQEDRGKFVPNIFVCRIGASMYFANASFVKDSLIRYVDDLENVNPTEYLVVEMTPVISIDSTAAHVIHDIVSHFRSQGIQVAFAQVGNRVDKVMKKASIDGLKLKRYIGENWIHPTVTGAVQYCLRHQHAKRKMRELGDAAIGMVNDKAMDQSVTVREKTEVGFSNEFAPDCTCVFVNLAKDVPMIMSEITAVFKKDHVTIVRAQIEPHNRGAKHTYFLRSVRTGAKLTAWEIERLREELEALLEVVTLKQAVASAHDDGNNIMLPIAGIGNFGGGDSPSSRTDSRIAALAEALARERETNARIQAELEEQNAKISLAVSNQQRERAQRHNMQMQQRLRCDPPATSRSTGSPPRTLRPRSASPKKASPEAQQSEAEAEAAMDKGGVLAGLAHAEGGDASLSIPPGAAAPACTPVSSAVSPSRRQLAKGNSADACPSNDARGCEDLESPSP